MIGLTGLYANLKLTVNPAKSAVALAWERSFLGFGLWRAPGQRIARRLAPSALVKMQERVRAITARNGGRSLRHVSAELRRYLYRNLYYNPVVHEPNQRAVRMLRELFQHFSEHPKEVGSAFRKRARREGWPRTVCDYLAGMTDRFALQEHQRLFGLSV